MAPFIRILLRYGVGGLIGYEVGSQLAADPDVLAVTTVAALSLRDFTFSQNALAGGCNKEGW